MRTAMLAEAIILQAIDDLYDRTEHDMSVEFFTGDGFAECAELAGMDHERKMGVLEVVSRVVSAAFRPGFSDICVQGGHGWMRRSRSAGAQGLC